MFEEMLIQKFSFFILITLLAAGFTTQIVFKPLPKRKGYDIQSIECHENKICSRTFIHINGRNVKTSKSFPQDRILTSGYYDPFEFHSLTSTPTPLLMMKQSNVARPRQSQKQSTYTQSRNAFPLYTLFPKKREVDVERGLGSWQNYFPYYPQNVVFKADDGNEYIGNSSIIETGIVVDDVRPTDKSIIDTKAYEERFGWADKTWTSMDMAKPKWDDDTIESTTVRLFDKKRRETWGEWDYLPKSTYSPERELISETTYESDEPHLNIILQTAKPRKAKKTMLSYSLNTH